MPKTPPPEPEEEVQSVKHSVAQIEKSEEEDIHESPKSLSQQTPKEEVATEENQLEEEEPSPQNE